VRNVLTIGTFDLFHQGHVELLTESRRIADELNANLIVGVNSDAFVERYKGHAPRLSYDIRSQIVSYMKGVDAVLLNVGDEDAKPLIEVVNPIRLTIGDDWLDHDHRGDPIEDRYFKQLGVDKPYMWSRGLGVIYLPRTKNISSTELRK
jgi:glycerol-3-phosphate cytidylyltransferase